MVAFDAEVPAMELTFDGVVVLAVVTFAVVLAGALVFYFTSDDTDSAYEALSLSVGLAFVVASLVLCCGLAGLVG
jgi:hypothetical protein